MAARLASFLLASFVCWPLRALAPADEIERLLAAGLAAFDAARYAEGLESAERALAAARAAGQRGRELEALILVGRCHFRRSSFDLARPLFVEAQALAGTLGRIEESDAWRLIGDVDNAQSRPDQAREAYERALPVAEAAGDARRQSQALRQLGWLRARKSEHAEARVLYERSLSLAERTADPDQIGLTESLIGVLEGAMGNLAEAEARYLRAIALLQQAGNRHGVASQRLNLGTVQFRRGQYREALEAFRDARRFYETAGNRNLAALALDNEASVLSSLGHSEESLAAHRQAFDARKAHGDEAGAAEALNNLASVHAAHGDLGSALGGYLDALAIHEQLGRKDHIGVVLGNICDVYEAQGRLDLAEDYARRAVATLEAAGAFEYLVTAWLRLARVRLAQGALDESEALTRKSLALAQERGFQPSVATAHARLGKVAAARGRLDEARREHTAARESHAAQGARLSAANQDLELARLTARAGDWARASRDAQAVAALAESESARGLLLEARTLSGQALLAQGDRAGARAAFETAAGTAEELRGLSVGDLGDRQRAFESQVAPYQALIGLAAESGDPRDTLAQMERTRARLLLDQLAAGQVLLALHPEERARERDLKDQLVSAEAQLEREQGRSSPDASRVAALRASRDAARRASEAFRTELLARRPELRMRGAGAPTLAADEVARQAGPGTVLVEYGFSGEAVWAVAVTLGDGQPLARLARLALPAAEVAERSQQLADAIARRDLRSAALARKLHEVLLAPFEDLLGGSQSLVVAPDGPLWRVPFQALVDPRGRALLERLPVSYTPSLAAWIELKRQRAARGPSRGPLLAIGDPEGAGPSAALRHTGSLLRALEVAEPGGRMLAGTQASEAAFKRQAGQFGVLQLATHGALDDASPLYSHLRLAAGEGQDGRLEAREVLDLQLPADLAVLSACETARGRFAEGEGVVGLSWAFFMAGVPRVVVSHWKVEAASTTQLMLALHRNLRGGRGRARLGVAEALRQAALSLRRDPRYRHPFYWSAFAVLGDGG